MNKRLFMTMLYDFYGQLLTDKQKDVIEMYYLNDFSLSEIGEEHNITRQSVLDMLKRAESSLISYEDKLKLVERYLKQKDFIYEALSILDKTNENEKINRVKEILKGLLADV